MAVTLKRLESVISNLEDQTQEIEQYKNVIKRISDIELEVQKIIGLSNKSSLKLTELLSEHSELLNSFESKFNFQNSILKNIKHDTNKKIGDFSHEFIEKISVIRDESLNAHIDLRQDIERVNKDQKQIGDSIKQISEELSGHKIQNSQEQDERFQKLEVVLFEQNKKISLSNKLGILVSAVTISLLSLSIYFLMK